MARMTAPAQRGIVGCEEAVEGRGINMADCVGARPHGGVEARRPPDAACNGVLADPGSAVGRQASRAFPTASAWPRGSGTLLVQLLLVSQEQVAPREASRALWAFERLLFGMRALVPLQMLEACKRALARPTHMGPRLVGFRRGKGSAVRGWGRVGFGGLDGSCLDAVVSQAFCVSGRGGVQLPLLALLEALPETAEGPMVAVSASVGMLNNYGSGVTSARNPHATGGDERPEGVNRQLG
jgi:hypothetical protein